MVTYYNHILKTQRDKLESFHINSNLSLCIIYYLILFLEQIIHLLQSFTLSFRNKFPDKHSRQ